MRDDWQGKGIGSSLLEKCLVIAERQGFKTVHGIVLAENKNMLMLGKKLGFEIKRDPDTSDNNLVIHLGKGDHECNGKSAEKREDDQVAAGF